MAPAFRECTIDAASPEEDLRFLEAEVDAGAQFRITQVFFGNRYHFDFVARAPAIGIDVPIVRPSCRSCALQTYDLTVRCPRDTQ